MNTVRSIGDKIIYVHHGEKAWEGTSATIETEGTEGLLRFINASVEDQYDEFEKFYEEYIE